MITFNENFTSVTSSNGTFEMNDKYIVFLSENDQVCSMTIEDAKNVLKSEVNAIDVDGGAIVSHHWSEHGACLHIKHVRDTADRGCIEEEFTICLPFQVRRTSGAFGLRFYQGNA